ncbi:MAG: hypothetical protein KGI38_02385 [Thaumarchaeota archaeon]|nr:hypothetical protein [Nitrososphaerota archaeon]
MKVIDWQLGLTLVYVEVPIGVIVSILVSYLLRESAKQAQLAVAQAQAFAKETQKLQDERIRIGEVKARLSEHYQGVLHSMQFWFDDLQPSVPTGSAYEPKLTYTVARLVAAYWYSPPPKTDLRKLETRTYVEESAPEVEAPLRGENWSKWVALRERANAHLTRVGELWQKVVDDIRSETSSLGLKEWDGTLALGKPVDHYWLHRLFTSLWLDYDSFQGQGTHLWDDANIVQGDDDYNRKKVWFFYDGGVQSTSREALEELKIWLPTEANAIAPAQKELREDADGIALDYDSLHRSWGKVERDYRGKRAERLLGSCPTCADWLAELDRLKTSGT